MAAAAAIVCIAASTWFIRAFNVKTSPMESCTDRSGTYNLCRHSDGTYHPCPSSLGADVIMARYYACADAKAHLFITHDYAEAKDLTKAFLTLLIAVLVASITFSEKIVDVRASSWWSAGAVIVCWILLLAAIASAGCSLALMSRAAADATYWPHVNFRPLENSAVGLLKAAGIFFGSGLVALLVAGVVSLADRRRRA